MVTANMNLGEWLQGLAFSTMRKNGAPLATDMARGLADRFHATAGSDENSTISNPYGGFLIPTKLGTELIDKARTSSKFARRSFRVPMPTSGQLDLPALRETSRVDGERAIAAYWAVQTSQLTSTRGELQQLALRSKGLRVLVPVSNKLLGAGPAFEIFIRRAVAEAIAAKIDDAIYDGQAGVPTGILSSPATITVSKEANQAAGTILSENVHNMVARLWPYSDATAAWFCSRSAHKDLLRDSSLNDLIAYAPPGAAGDVRMTLAGYPVVVTEQNATIGAKGDLVLWDCDQYVISDGGLQESMSAEVRLENDESIFRFFIDIDGMPGWREPITPANNADDSQSPFIVLEDRT